MLKQEIRKNWRRIIPSLLDTAKRRVNGETSYICTCGHGTHGDGLTVNPKSSDGNGLKCFGCGWSGDIISLHQKVVGTDYNTTLSLLAQQLGIEPDNRHQAPDSRHRTSDIRSQTADIRRQTPDSRHLTSDICNLTSDIRSQTTDIRHQAPDSTHRTSDICHLSSDICYDFSCYYQECLERINEPAAVEYLNNRGISVETAKMYMIGFDPESDPANNPGGQGTSSHPCPRLILPTSSSHYVGRRIDGLTEFAKINPKNSSPGLFNIQALYEQPSGVVFVTEGVFDALSVIETGSPAIALNSTSNIDILLKQLEKEPTSTTLILCLDKDKAGCEGEQKLIDGLERLKITQISADICKEYKDPNEALKANKAAFIASIEDAKRKASAKPDSVDYYIDNIMNSDIEQFSSEIKTGYSNLDSECGGLYAGLYCIAAISSLGKTTFASQMADQIASSGHDVLFFSLEQSRLELVSKSISRVVAQKDLERSVTSLSIRKGYTSMNVRAAAQEYKYQVKDHLSIIEGNFNCNVAFIDQYVRQFIKRTKTRPVVFIDYLQILQGESLYHRKSSKEIIDNTVTELKRISRDLGLTLFVISSVNRTNYNTPIDFESLKESGGIEYTCDVIWGLQLHCLNEPLFDKQQNIKERRERIKQAKSENPRKIELVCLKNRYGSVSFNCLFDYFPASDLFIPALHAIPSVLLPKKAGRKL